MNFCDKRVLLSVILVIYSILLTLSGFAQQVGIPFKHISLNEGLSQSPIFSIKQDARGFIWIGSRDGLTRFDGHEFKIYNNYDFDRNGINHRDINAIVDDPYHNIWLGTTSGLYQFNLKSETYSYVPIPGVTRVSCFLGISKTLALVGTDKGIILLDYYSKKIKPVKALSNQDVRILFKDKSGHIWVGMNSGLSCLNATFDRATTMPSAISGTPKLLNSKVVSIKQDGDTDLWFGTEDEGLFRFRNQTNAVSQYTANNNIAESLLSNFVRDIFIEGDRFIWVATRNGLSVLDKNKNLFTNYQHHSEDVKSLSHNAIWNIMQDEAGSIWLTTYAGGLNVYHPSNGNFVNIGEKVGNSIGLNRPVVNALVQDEKENLWIAADGGGLNFINKQGTYAKYFDLRDFKNGRISNIIKCIADGKDGKLWLGTLDGLAVFNKSTGTYKYLELGDGSGKDQHKRINAVIKSSSGIWSAFDLDGLKVIDRTGKVLEFKASTRAGDLKSNHTNALQEGKTGIIWIGTNNGLDLYDTLKKSFTHFQNDVAKYGSNRNVVLSLFIDANERLWVGTRKGLQLFDQDKKAFYHFDDDEEIANSVIESISQDQLGNLWIGTNNGLFKMTFNFYRKALSKPNYQIIRYSFNDGLASNQFLPNAVATGRDGHMYFGGVNGVTSFNPIKIIKNDHVPRLVITEFMIHNQIIGISTPGSPLQEPIENTRHIKLKYNQNFISFKLAALDYINPNKSPYAYRLFGRNFNDQWHVVNNQRIADYTDLRPGVYTFKVKGVKGDGIWNNETIDLTIEILPPMWMTWWAYIIYVLASVSVLYYIILFFRRKAQLERDLYYEHLQYERQQELHQMKLEFFTNISHEIRTPLTLMSAPVEVLLEESRDNPRIYKQIHRIQDNTNRLLRLINELLDFRKAEEGKINLLVRKVNFIQFTQTVFDMFRPLAEQKCIDFTISCKSDNIGLYVDEVQLEKVFLNLLSNAFKFTPQGGRISLYIKDEDDKVTVHVRDNGKGILSKFQNKLFTNFYQAENHYGQYTGSGVGLALSKKIVELHHGEIHFFSVPEEAGKSAGDTCFTVTIPKGWNHFDEGQLDSSNHHSLLQTVPDLQTEKLSSPVLGHLEYLEEQEKKEVVLVVEDNDEVRLFLTESLSDCYRVQGCSKGLEGFETAVNTIPDLIISDVMMPEMDGVELCSKLKHDERTSHIPVLLLTARASVPQQISGLTTGADAYITKPFSLQVLKLNIKNLLHARKVMQRKYSQQVTLEPKQVVISGVDEAFLARLMRIIDENLDDSEFDVTTLSQEIGMSRPVLYRKIKGLTDLSVADFIKSLRLKKAVMLLVQNKMSIADIASAVGFGTRKHFSQEFRKQYGCRPSDYADLHQPTVESRI